MKDKNSPSDTILSNFLVILKTRFEKNMQRHPNLEWNNIEEKLNKEPKKLHILYKMEETGGEPDVIIFNKNEDCYNFIDCSKESPQGRRSLCYDRESQEERKNYAPKNNVMDMAREIGIQLLTSDDYNKLQTLGEFDTKTSSWIETPPSIRKLGGALFADRRYNNVFIYHNGAQSYYASRGFRGMLKV